MPKTANATLDKAKKSFPLKINLPNKQNSYHDIDDSGDGIEERIEGHFDIRVFVNEPNRSRQSK